MKDLIVDTIVLLRGLGLGEHADALEQAQARIAELEAGLAFKEALLAGDGALITGLKEENAALALQVQQMREALAESNALNINWSLDAEPHVLEYFSEYRNVIKQGNEALSTAPATEAIEEYRRKVKVETIAECAAICDKYDNSRDANYADFCAEEIRALAAAPDDDKVEKEVG